MRRTFWLAAAAVALAAPGPEARAQFGYGYYPSGYGSYGWGGWGTGGTVVGSNARGLGVFAAGAGSYNRQTAAANAINADTVMRWNEYLYESQLETNRRYHARRGEELADNQQNYDEIHKRIRENPTDRDIANGDALNAVLDEVAAPDAYDSTIKAARDPIRGNIVREIPFIYAAQAVVFSLGRLSAEEGWPPLLATETFQPEREAYRTAIDGVLKRIDEGELTPEDIRPVEAALRGLRTKLLRGQAQAAAQPQAQPPAGRPNDATGQAVAFGEAQDYLNTLAGMTRMLRRPDFEKVLAELEKIDETTMGDMFAFMHTFNLRFGPAETPRQRQIYAELYPRLATLRDQMARTDSQASGARAESEPKAEPKAEPRREPAKGAQQDQPTRRGPDRPTGFFQGFAPESLFGGDGKDQPAREGQPEGKSEPEPKAEPRQDPPQDNPR